MNETEGLLDAVRLGLGVGQMPDLLAQDALDRGELVELLPALRPEPMAIQLVYPSGRLLPSRVRVALDCLSQGLRQRQAGPAQALGPSMTSAAERKPSTAAGTPQ